MGGQVGSTQFFGIGEKAWYQQPGWTLLGAATGFALALGIMFREVYRFVFRKRKDEALEMKVKSVIKEMTDETNTATQTPAQEAAAEVTAAVDTPLPEGVSNKAATQPQEPPTGEPEVHAVAADLKAKEELAASPEPKSRRVKKEAASK